MKRGKKQEEGGEIFRSLAKKYPQEERIVCCYGRYCQEKDTWDGTIALYDAVLEAHPIISCKNRKDGINTS